MKTQDTLPEWFTRDFGPGVEDNIFAWTSVHTDESQEDWYFTGVVAEMIRMRKLPMNLEIAYDMDAMVGIIRMEFAPGGDGKNREGRWKALYTFIDFEGFALLWNAQPSEIHGFPADSITLHLNANDQERPSRTGHVPTLIRFEDGKFFVKADPEHAKEEMFVP